jgi:hypothetical protein
MKARLTAQERADLLKTLQDRFVQNSQRHPQLVWAEVQARLEAQPAKLWSLWAMEHSGGEPDVVAHDAGTGEFTFYDCSPETPRGRVSLCYDRAGWEARKEHRPATSAQELAAEMGIALLTESQYLALQTLGEFDRKTSSWVQTPEAVRRLGGALYGERRYGRIFIGHNGAQSYYAVRGFRGALRI